MFVTWVGAKCKRDSPRRASQTSPHHSPRIRKHSFALLTTMAPKRSSQSSDDEESPAPKRRNKENNSNDDDDSSTDCNIEEVAESL